MKDIHLKDTGERMIPDVHSNSLMYAEHVSRYLGAQNIVKNKIVLDIACGTGYGAKLLSSVANKVYGVDNPPEAIEYAKTKYNASNIEYIIGTAENIPLPDKSVDVIVTFETIEHIEKFNIFIKQMHRVLKEDGLIIISTPNDDEFTEGNDYHVHQFKSHELTAALKKEFKYQKFYHQATWNYVQISDDSFTTNQEAVAETTVHNFAPLTPDKYLYFYILCSNREISESVDYLGSLGGHYSAKEIVSSRESAIASESHIKKMNQEIDDLKNRLGVELEEHKKTTIKLKAKEREIHDITQSSSYKLARLLALSKHSVKRSINIAKDLNPRRVNMLAKNRKHVTNVYGSQQFLEGLQVPATSKLAVVIHLYYVEMLPFFIKKLQNLAHLDYDLFITVPITKKEALLNVQKRAPHARIVLVPNCGRDVLPFVAVMKQIHHLGYDKILKLHSKKSPHRTDGSAWRDRIVNSLIPENKAHLDQTIELLNNPSTALVGPAGEYTSLLVNFSATAHYIKNLTGKVLDTRTASDLISTADEYGFFAGTMFWARTDALMDIINNVGIDDFEPELGQEDSTLAHALERLFNVIPELQSKHLYELRSNGPVEIDHHTTHIPEWSDVALDK